jgi:hypothetical protein
MEDLWILGHNLDIMRKSWGYNGDMTCSRCSQQFWWDGQTLLIIQLGSHDLRISQIFIDFSALIISFWKILMRWPFISSKNRKTTFIGYSNRIWLILYWDCFSKVRNLASFHHVRRAVWASDSCFKCCFKQLTTSSPFWPATMHWSRAWRVSVCNGAWVQFPLATSTLYYPKNREGRKQDEPENCPYNVANPTINDALATHHKGMIFNHLQ